MAAASKHLGPIHATTDQAATGALVSRGAEAFRRLSRAEILPPPPAVRALVVAASPGGSARRGPSVLRQQNAGAAVGKTVAKTRERRTNARILSTGLGRPPLERCPGRESNLGCHGHDATS
jgi:hypothetical protein